MLSISLLVFLAWLSQTLTVTIVLGGDVMLARGGSPIIGGASAFGDALPVIRKADLASVNLESPLAYEQPPDVTSGYNLCAPASSAVLLKNAGLDALSIENNHSMDCNATGDLETQKWLAEEGITAISDPESLRVFKLKGQKIAFLAYEDITRPLDIGRVLNEVSKAKNASDVLVVSLHWGNEYQAGPDGRQMNIAQQLADAGVDVIWGHHPHVLQRIEWLGSTHSTHQTLVIYSLGNLISDQYMLEDAQRTALVTISLRNGRITDISIDPMTMDRMSNTLSIAQGNERITILDRLKWSAEIPEIRSLR